MEFGGIGEKSHDEEAFDMDRPFVFREEFRQTGPTLGGIESPRLSPVQSLFWFCDNIKWTGTQPHPGTRLHFRFPQPVKVGLFGSQKTVTGP